MIMFTKVKKQAVSIANGKGITKADKHTVDTNLLFQRIVRICNKEDTPSLFTYELCSVPSSLVESSKSMRKANKPELANTLYKMIENNQNVQYLPSEVTYVIDGGSLLHKIPWKIGTTYQSIYDHYVDCLKNFWKSNYCV